MSWLKRNWYIIALVVVNLALSAAPTEAGIKNDLCINGDGNEVGCCSHCTFFCGCQFVE